jgi:hypothetical protein
MPRPYIYFSRIVLRLKNDFYLERFVMRVYQDIYLPLCSRLTLNYGVSRDFRFRILSA